MHLVIHVADINQTPVVAAITETRAFRRRKHHDSRERDRSRGTSTHLERHRSPSFATFADNGNGTGVITVNSHQGDRGDYVLTVLATDDGDGGLSLPQTGTAVFVFSVTSANEPPVMSAIGNRIAVIGQDLTFNVKVSDEDQDPLTYSVVGLPSGATFVGTSTYGVATFHWKPAAGDAGLYTITLRVTDSGNQGATSVLGDEETIGITVCAPANTAPTLTAVGDITSPSGNPVTIQLSSADADGDTRTYTLANAPLGSSFNPITGQFTWTPRLTDAGTYFLNFSVTDGGATVAKTVTLTVTATNLPPVFAPVLSQTGQEGTTMAFSVVAGDPNGDLPTLFVAGGLPAGAVFSASAGLFLWTPSFSQAGTRTVRFGAVDSQGLQSFLDVSITIENVNRPPTIANLSARQLLVGQTFNLAVPGSDADAEDAGLLTYTAQNLPAGASFNSAGRVRLDASRLTARLAFHQLRGDRRLRRHGERDASA